MGSIFDKIAAERIKKQREKAHLSQFADEMRELSESLFTEERRLQQLQTSSKRRELILGRLKPKIGKNNAEIFGTLPRFGQEFEHGIIVGSHASLALHGIFRGGRQIGTELSEVYFDGHEVRCELRAFVTHEPPSKANPDRHIVFPEVVVPNNLRDIHPYLSRASNDTVNAVRGIVRAFTS